MSDAQDPLAGLKAPAGYELLSVLGRGGMGVVVKARLTAGGRLVALKYLHRVDADVRERFMREARLATELRHPNIIAGLGVEFVDDAPVLVFDFLESTDLSAVIRRERRLAPERAIAIMRQILVALDHAHRAGVVHRDLKSANVLLAENGVAKLADFGVAHLRDAQERLTRTGAVLGTPAYMAPEQAEGSKIDERTDIYAAGVILFEMLTGTYPISGLSPLDMMQRVRVDTPLRVTDLVPEVDLRLTDVVARCLEKKPGDRFPSAEALLIALDPQAVLAERPQATLPDSPEGGFHTVSGPTRDASSAAGRPRRTTGRVRVLANPGLPGGPIGAGGPLPVRSGVTRAVGRTTGAHPPSALTDTIDQAPPRPRRRGWAIVAALAVLAVGAQVWRSRRHAPEDTGTVAIARPLAILNSADSGFLALDGGRPVLAFETDPADDLAAVVSSGRGQESLKRVPELCHGNRQVFEAPAALLLDPFSVRFTRADGAPVAGGVVSHPGLFSVVETWRQKLKLTAEGDVAGAPRGPRWAQLVDALDGALGGAPGAFVKIGASTRPMDSAAAAPLSRALALRAKKALAPLFAAAPLLLDLPDTVLPLSRRQLVHDALLAPRLLDRLLTVSGQRDVMLGADGALGARFRAGVAPDPSPPEVDNLVVRGWLMGWGAPKGDAEDQHLFSLTVEKNIRKPPQESMLLVLTLGGSVPAKVARLDLHCHKAEGSTEALPADEVLWVALPDHGWRLLVTAANAAPLEKSRAGDGVFEHWLDPGLLDSTTRVRLTRELLPSTSRHDRRIDFQFIERLGVRRD